VNDLAREKRTPRRVFQTGIITANARLAGRAVPQFSADAQAALDKLVKK